MTELRGGAASLESSLQGADNLSFVFDRIMRLPDGERILECIQCGTCGGACPVSFAMDRTPRQVINLLRSGRVEEALSSESIWICTSCYNCTVQCPSGIKITEVMYSLKVASTELGIHYKGALGPVFAKSFVRQLESRGRVNEVILILRVGLHKPRLLLTAGLSTYLKLLRAGRVKLRPEKVKGIDELRRMNSWIIAGDPPSTGDDGP